LAVFFSVLVFLAFNACTVKHRTIPAGEIPKMSALTPGEAEFGKSLFEHLCEDNRLDLQNEGYSRLKKVFDHLIQAAQADHLPWQLHLFKRPDLADVRAVHGNYIFVWSGFLDIVQNEDEIAGVMACEISHVLARHTYPVQFTLWSDVFFDAAELATNIAIMYFSQGAVSIHARGWMKWAYVEISDMDPLDREYSEAEEREAIMIAMQILDRSKYDPQAMLSFWQRVQQDEALQIKVQRLNRKLGPRRRTEIVKEFLHRLPQKAKLHFPNNLSTGPYHSVSPASPIQSTSMSIPPSEGS
jgi:predicted Zn-dependent protease